MCLTILYMPNTLCLMAVNNYEQYTFGTLCGFYLLYVIQSSVHHMYAGLFKQLYDFTAPGDIY